MSVEGSGPKRIFVVDDEVVIATTLGLIFKGAGFVSTSYTDPLDLLRACEVETPDAVVSDVMMPTMTGIELAVRLGELHPTCKVILVSGQAATSELLHEARLRGQVFSVLAKPIHPAVLIQHVQDALSDA